MVNEEERKEAISLFKKYNGFSKYTDKDFFDYLNDKNNWFQMMNEYATKEAFEEERENYDEWNDNYYCHRYIESHFTLAHPKTKKHIDLWKLQKLEKVGIELLKTMKSTKRKIKCDLGFIHCTEVVYNKNKFDFIVEMSDEEIRNYLNNLEDDKWYKPHPLKKVKFYYRPKEIETIKKHFF